MESDRGEETQSTAVARSKRIPGCPLGGAYDCAPLHEATGPQGHEVVCIPSVLYTFYFVPKEEMRMSIFFAALTPTFYQNALGRQLADTRAHVTPTAV